MREGWKDFKNGEERKQCYGRSGRVEEVMWRYAGNTE